MPDVRRRPPLEVNARTQADAAAELQSLGERLVRLSPEELNGVPLSEALRDAVLEAQRLTPRSEAMRRQLQYVGKLMRSADADSIAIALEDIGSGAHAAELQQRAESWRDRLLATPDAALQQLVAAYPECDRQRLRQISRKAAKELLGTPGRAARERELVAALRELMAGRF